MLKKLCRLFVCKREQKYPSDEENKVSPDQDKEQMRQKIFKKKQYSNVDQSEKNSDITKTLYKIAHSFQQKGMIRESILIYEKIILSNPLSIKAYIYKSECLNALELFEDSYKCIGEAINRRPIIIEQMLIDIIKQQDKEQSLNFIKKTIFLFPEQTTRCFMYHFRFFSNEILQHSCSKNEQIELFQQFQQILIEGKNLEKKSNIKQERFKSDFDDHIQKQALLIYDYLMKRVSADKNLTNMIKIQQQPPINYATSIIDTN